MSVTGDFRPARGVAANGFTLLEMLVTLGIASLVAGILFPALQHSLDFWGQRAAVASVRSALAEARSLALRTASPVTFAFNGGGDGFSVANRAPVRLPAFARLSASARALVFYPDGSASGGRIAIRSGAMASLLLISPDTGLASLGQ